MPKNITSSKQNIVLYQHNITRHFTEANKIIVSRKKNIIFSSIIVVLCIASITFLTGNIFGINITNSNNGNASALSYQTESNISFTFSPMISISISSNTIDIPSLTPGTTAESNPITVTVSTNTAYGYSLYADVGNSTGYNTDSLVHSGEDNNNNTNSTPSVFTSIATNASLPSLTTDNTWGYSFKPSNESNWSVYNGLPLYTTTDSHTSTSNPALLIDTKDAADNTKSIDFKIAARSSSTQPSGTYNNVINFYAVGKPEPPTYYMQDTATLKTVLKNTRDTVQAIDTRDGKEYWVTKMADGKIWMTQNLDLDLSTSIELTPANTDISANWTPVNSTIVSTGAWMSDWKKDYNIPYSADLGEVYVYSSGTADNDDQYTSLADCQVAHPDCSMHNHVGNYYNWSAAVASNNTSSMTSQYSNAPGSVCPAGWRLPTGRNKNNTAASREWNALLYAEGVASSPTSSGYTSDGFNKIRTAPLWLVRSGVVNSGSFQALGNSGSYWSKTIYTSSNAYYLEFYGSLIPSMSNPKDSGRSVRCVAQ